MFYVLPVPTERAFRQNNYGVNSPANKQTLLPNWFKYNIQEKGTFKRSKKALLRNENLLIMSCENTIPKCATFYSIVVMLPNEKT